ncbi:alpha/beta-hydrolase [Mycena pura]|uniref:Alpha/beta-hydrolase n=1 Tax=Mycena pura TaxID=153505 RepID=A0AAD6YCM9_9AGAR|nr:alpha/beta-hydrolase [Mycena pura]
MAFAFRHQPLKSLYLASAIFLLLFVRIPIWTIQYSFPFGRPRRQWSLGRSLIVSALGFFIDVLYTTSLLPSPSIEKLAEKGAEAGFVWIEATPSLIHGEILEKAKTNGVEAVRTGGFWFGERGADGAAGQKAGPDELVFYHFHGGAFVMGTSDPSTSANKTLFLGLLRHNTKVRRVFALEYRLSSAPPFASRHPFPAALIDSIAGYRYLVEDVGFNPSNIIISGDSAGGNLAYALTRYISTDGAHGLPHAGALLLLSPTVDWADTHIGADSSIRRNARTDFVHPIFTSRFTYRALQGSLPDDEVATNSWISPGSLKIAQPSGIFAAFPRTLIVSGSVEMTLDPIRTLRDRMVDDMGKDRVRYLEVPESTHDFMTQTWHEPERTNTLKLVGNWVDSL